LSVVFWLKKKQESHEKEMEMLGKVGGQEVCGREVWLVLELGKRGKQGGGLGGGGGEEN